LQSFNFYLPTEVIFGKDTELTVAEEIRKYGGNRVLIIYGGGSVVRSGLLKRIQNLLREAGLLFKEVGGVKPNPVLSFAREIVDIAKEFDADFILAVGGGSVIDTAKAVALGAASPETDIWQYWLREAEIKKSVPVGVVLTIPAAGSETSSSAVLTDEENMSKRGLTTDYIRPKFAVMNPELTYTLPKYQIACGIVDIMMHTLDRYFTPTEGNELTDEYAEALLRVAIKNGSKALKNPNDYDAMSELMWCGSISHNGLTGLGAAIDFAPHQLGHELSARFDAAHGASLAAVWGSWAEFCCSRKPERFVRFGGKVWGLKYADEKTAVHGAIDRTVEYFASLGMPTCFSEMGIGIQSEETLRELADSCVFHGKRTVGSFRVLEADDIYEIYRLANR
jgi:alcohol dehydrogenase YqhD (iron-dependent ADH family)